MKGDKGQIYLITTIIIIAVVIGFVTISNYAQKQDSVKIYDLGEELNIEGENVLDYGIYNGLDKEATAELLRSFYTRLLRIPRGRYRSIPYSW